MSVHSGVKYIQCHSALSRRCACLGLWAGQYPSRVNIWQPGCLHGRSGFKAMGYHLQANKKRPSHDTHHGLSLAQALVSWDAGSGASIFTMLSFPHLRQYTGRSWAMVWSRSFRTLPFPQTGHISHPFLMVSLSDSEGYCNLFTDFLFSPWGCYRWFPDR